MTDKYKGGPITFELNKESDPYDQVGFYISFVLESLYKIKTVDLVDIVIEMAVLYRDDVEDWRRSGENEKQFVHLFYVEKHTNWVWEYDWWEGQERVIIYGIYPIYKENNILAKEPQ